MHAVLTRPDDPWALEIKRALKEYAADIGGFRGEGAMPPRCQSRLFCFAYAVHYKVVQ